MNHKSIIDELIASGATRDEAKELAKLSQLLTSVGKTSLTNYSTSARRSQAQTITGSATREKLDRRMAYPLATLGFALVGILVVIVTLSSALPGGTFYGAKRSSERLVADVFPAYRDQMMMHRSVEIKALIDHHGSTKLVDQTVSDYIHQVHAVTRSNYTALEYCTTMLKEARLHAAGADLKDIDTGLEAAEQQEDVLAS